MKEKCIVVTSFIYAIIRKRIYVVKLFLHQVRDFVNQPFRLFPAQAGVGDGFAVGAAVNLLVAVFYIAFYHKALDKVVNACIIGSVLQDFPDDAALLVGVFAGVGVVGVNDDGGVLEALFFIEFVEEKQVLVVVGWAGGRRACWCSPGEWHGRRGFPGRWPPSHGR